MDLREGPERGVREEGGRNGAGDAQRHAHSGLGPKGNTLTPAPAASLPMPLAPQGSQPPARTWLILSSSALEAFCAMASLMRLGLVTSWSSPTIWHLTSAVMSYGRAFEEKEGAAGGFSPVALASTPPGSTGGRARSRRVARPHGRAQKGAVPRPRPRAPLWPPTFQLSQSSCS